MNSSKDDLSLAVYIFRNWCLLLLSSLNGTIRFNALFKLGSEDEIEPHGKCRPFIYEFRWHNYPQLGLHSVCIQILGHLVSRLAFIKLIHWLCRPTHLLHHQTATASRLQKILFSKLQPWSECSFSDTPKQLMKCFIKTSATVVVS